MRDYEITVMPTGTRAISIQASIYLGQLLEIIKKELPDVPLDKVVISVDKVVISPKDNTIYIW